MRARKLSSVPTRRVLCALFLALPSSLLAQPALSFETQAAVVSGLTPGGQVVWFSVARESSEGVATIVRRERIDVADVQGGARFDLDREVPYKSIWVAVDLATGASTVATRPDFPLVEVDLPASDLLPGGGAQTSAIQDPRDAVEMLVVRPGTGAWGILVGRGGSNDEAGGDGPLRASLSRMQPVGSSPVAPSSFDPKDLVILIDPNRLEIARGRADGSKP
jgi:hypothetical protein